MSSTPAHVSGLGVPRARKIWKSWSISMFSLGKSGAPLASSPNTAPTLHMSIGIEYFTFGPPSRISGARYHSVTTSWVRLPTGGATWRLRPHPAITSRPVRRSTSRLSGLMSRCRVARECAASTPRSSCHMSMRTVSAYSGTSSSSDGGVWSSSNSSAAWKNSGEFFQAWRAKYLLSLINVLILTAGPSTAGPSARGPISRCLSARTEGLGGALPPAPGWLGAHSSTTVTALLYSGTIMPSSFMSRQTLTTSMLLVPLRSCFFEAVSLCALRRASGARMIHSRGGCRRLVSMRSKTIRTRGPMSTAACSFTTLGQPCRCRSAPSSRTVPMDSPSASPDSAHLIATRRPVRRSRPRYTEVPGGSAKRRWKRSPGLLRREIVYARKARGSTTGGGAEP
mmetsp:Transcript_7986/g.32434  ORF Transcript_7986/g.32434 Transcript_7986/m.32434 type:complete len:396 (-) Transcript_7986:16-1203(-)